MAENYLSFASPNYTMYTCRLSESLTRQRSWNQVLTIMLISEKSKNLKVKTKEISIPCVIISDVIVSKLYNILLYFIDLVAFQEMLCKFNFQEYNLKNVRISLSDA